MVTSEEREAEERQYKGREKELQIFRYTKSYKDILYNTGNNVNIL